MKHKLLLAAALLLAIGAASAQTTTQQWTAGWDKFTEPLNYKTSKVSWSVNTTTKKLSVTFKLVGATPSKLYQVALQLFCTTSPATFGNYPVVFLNNRNCTSLPNQVVTQNTACVELVVITRY